VLFTGHAGWYSSALHARRAVHVMTNAEILHTLREAHLFHDFTETELTSFIELLDQETFPAGQCIVRQDEPGDCMYLLVSGRARVVHHSGGRDIELAVMKPADFFGEIALVDHGPRSADVEALEPCVLLNISQSAIGALAGVYPTAAYKFLIAIGRLMVDRLRKSNQRYIDSMLFPLAGKD
jgi:CRP-like cAMP-binding protein